MLGAYSVLLILGIAWATKRTLARFEREIGSEGIQQLIRVVGSRGRFVSGKVVVGNVALVCAWASLFGGKTARYLSVADRWKIGPRLSIALILFLSAVMAIPGYALFEAGAGITGYEFSRHIRLIRFLRDLIVPDWPLSHFVWVGTLCLYAVAFSGAVLAFFRFRWDEMQGRWVRKW